MKKNLHYLVQRALTGFAAGVMVAAGVWSLLIPSMEQSARMGRLRFVPAAVGFMLGVFFLLFLDRVIPHLHMNAIEPEGAKSSFQRTTMLVLAVTLHNIPEGMAVGVVYAGWAADHHAISAAGALALSLGIAIQNFPEGAIISMPLRSEGMGKGKAFVYGVLSGVVEPVGHFIAACNVNDVVPEYLRTEILQPKETVATISNAMDVGDPSNFVRILELFDKEFNQVKNKLSGYTIDDEETLKTIKRVEKDYGYVLDPHGAVAFVALEKYLAENGGKGFFLETAHPVKFPDSVEKATGKSVEIPKSLEELMKQGKFTTEINPQYEELKEFLLKK
jgi:zinc transporter ZupT